MNWSLLCSLIGSWSHDTKSINQSERGNHSACWNSWPPRGRSSFAGSYFMWLWFRVWLNTSIPPSQQTCNCPLSPLTCTCVRAMRDVSCHPSAHGQIANQSTRAKYLLVLFVQSHNGFNLIVRLLQWRRLQIEPRLVGGQHVVAIQLMNSALLPPVCLRTLATVKSEWMNN